MGLFKIYLLVSLKAEFIKLKRVSKILVTTEHIILLTKWMKYFFNRKQITYN